MYAIQAVKYENFATSALCIMLNPGYGNMQTMKIVKYIKFKTTIYFKNCNTPK